MHASAVACRTRMVIMRPMTCSFRYMTRQLVWPLFFIAIAMAGVIWLTQSLRFVDLILNRGLPAHTFFYLAILVLPMVMSVLLPVALFIAVVFSYTKMMMDSELVVLQACGMSHGELAKPALVVTAGVVFLCYLLNLYLMPMAYREFKDLQFSIRHNYSSVLLQEGAFNTVADGVTVYVRERHSDGELLGILVHDERDPEKPVTMMAERGALVQTPSGPRVVMITGNRQVVERTHERLSLLYFDRYTVDFNTVDQTEEERWREPRERFVHELFNPGDSIDDQRNLAIMRAEGHQRLASPLLAVAFAMIGLAALLAGEFNRRGQLRRILWATSAVITLQIGYLGAANLAATIPPAALLLYLMPLAAAVVAGYVLLVPAGRRGMPSPAEILSRV
jgi:lipopolysaccharide export system permease protein